MEHEHKQEHRHAHEHEHEHEHCHCHDCGCGHEHGGEEGGKPLRLAIAAIFFAVGLCLSFTALPPFASRVAYAIAYLIAGYRVLFGAAKGLFTGGIFDEEFLMSIASIGAFCIGEYAEGCAVMLLFEFGEWLQDLALDRSRDSIRDMLESRPETVRVLRDGKETVIPAETIEVGDLLLILPGEKVVCDGVVASGCGDLDVSSLTGESLPVAVHPGDKVLSGSVSVDSTLRVRVATAYNESTVAKILELLEDAKERKSPTESFIHRFAKIYTPAVCFFALGVAILPPILGYGDFSTWIYRGLCALAASCPCALVLSIPLGLFCGLGTASRTGVLVKGGNYLEALAHIEGVALDKTGTVTTGKFAPVGEENAPSDEELHFALSVCERYSTHPIALAAIEAFGTVEAEIADAAALPGLGVRAAVNGEVYLCGNARLMQENHIAFVPATLPGTAVYAAKNGEFLGSVTFADTVKPDSADAICELRTMGIADTLMLTGDKRAIAEEVAARVGISAVKAELLPADKVNAFAETKGDRSFVFVGDGINDAPVLALADVGVAMGGIGSAAAIEAADAVILGDSLIKLPAVIRIARRTMRIVHENIVFSLAIKLAIIVAAALGYASLWLAIFGDVGVCLLAILNALRILKK